MQKHITTCGKFKKIKNQFCNYICFTQRMTSSELENKKDRTYIFKLLFRIMFIERNKLNL